MTRYIRPVLIIVILLLSNYVFAQNNGAIDKTIANFQKQATNASIEKTYLQLDKPYYAAGDTIWFKGYIVSGGYHQLSNMSNVLTVELINDRDLIKQSIKLYIKNGLCDGDIALPDSIEAGNYRIRAYTNWMRNAGEEYFFDKNVTIVNAIANNILATANYNYEDQNGLQKINTSVNYTDVDGKPYLNTKVNYTIQNGSKIIESGKGITDDKGNLKLSFINNTPGKENKVISNIALPDKTVATTTIGIHPEFSKIDVQFFPEGGTLINDIESKVAFKAVNTNGLGVPVSGIIVDDKNNEVARFNCGQLGMGTFTFKPERGRNYEAKIKNTNGLENIVQLPKATSNGYALSVCETGGDKIMMIAASDIPASSTDAVSLVAQSGGVIYYVGKSKPGHNSFLATVPKSKFPTGIVQFTLFSPDGEPLNERLMFIQNNDQLKLNIASEKQSYAPQQKVKLQLAAQTSDGKPAQGSFSVSVIDETKVPADESADNNILSNLLLTSDLKGYIEKPGYYFTHSDETTRADLDALMLTQGYRRFEWKKAFDNEPAATLYQPDLGLTISGSLTKTNGKPVANEKIVLYTLEGGFFSTDALTDNNGHFNFENMSFPDGRQFVAQSDEKNRFNLKLSIDLDKEKANANKNAAELVVNNYAELLPYLQNSKKAYNEEIKYDYNGKARLLKEVVIKERAQQSLPSPNSIFKFGHAEYVITAKQLMANTTSGRVSDHLFGLIPGIVYDSQGRIKKSPSRDAHPMAVVVDGALIDNIDQMTPNNIESIEVVKNTLFVTTKRGITDDDMTYTENMPGYKKFTPKGFYAVREFYSPQYDNPNTNKQIADLRSTIYWNPTVQTDKNGNASFEFFNAGSKGTYKVIVEGLDYSGNLAHQVYRYKVD